ncbi:MAG: hypothetical protein AABW83_01550 [Nanoarchaeota archaeon]
MKIRKIIINKKGILLSEGIRIILAVIALVLLIYLAVQLSGLFIKKSAQEQAKGSMKRLIEEIRVIENGKKMEAQLFIESPNDWWIIAWPYKEDKRKPNQCKGNYCVCICPVPGKVDFGSTLLTFENSLDYCNNLGVCEDVNKKIKTIYESASTGDKFGDITKSILDFFGGETKNVPIDINKPLPIKIKLVDNEIHVIK